jgi:hypothetical protein
VLGAGSSFAGCTVITGAESGISVGGSGNSSLAGTSGTSLIDLSGRECCLSAGVTRIFEGGNAPSLWWTGLVGPFGPGSGLEKAMTIRQILIEQERKYILRGIIGILGGRLSAWRGSSADMYLMDGCS